VTDSTALAGVNFFQKMLLPSSGARSPSVSVGQRPLAAATAPTTTLPKTFALQFSLPAELGLSNWVYAGPGHAMLGPIGPVWSMSTCVAELQPAAFHASLMVNVAP
jgi:hypothetical protein